MAMVVIPSEVTKKEMKNFQKWRESKENPYRNRTKFMANIQAREVGLYVAILKARGELNELEKIR